MSESLVSVIIPTYSGASFLGKAIRSVLDQTYPNFELIVVDDKSPDNTEEVVKQFDDPRIKYVRHETNQGAASARRTGCRASSGEIIAFLDQDDLFHRKSFRNMLSFWRSIQMSALHITRILRWFIHRILSVRFGSPQRIFLSPN